MKAFFTATALFGALLTTSPPLLDAQENEAASTLAALARAARAAPQDEIAQLRYAEFLDRYGDPEARAVYRKLTGPAKTAAVSRRIVLLDLIAGDRAAADSDLAAYHSAGGTDWKDVSWKAPAAAEPLQFITIPG
ncbi:MAG: hypothetical protein M3Z09_02420, partial [Acidobacteriota bacterium]|nr:hypothetical protein [Acidobacteriota bacterium]